MPGGVARRVRPSSILSRQLGGRRDRRRLNRLIERTYLQ
ncbi:hypothetical protein N177_0828 [Lutibaculum baratangense AMV1]|uniref:Uncharacterized protein n=1 Tax=Lutibaculum baratangense AMV1 TaxID=631454 RepID=V4RMU6_9HYPH|nr:hypothetical protein N177_0828 [Lutibaculum baratangense AMV1]